jgi:hypothetical protein
MVRRCKIWHIYSLGKYYLYLLLINGSIVSLSEKLCKSTIQFDTAP